MKGPVCPVYTFPHFHGMLLVPSVFRIMLSLMEKLRLETFLSRMPTHNVMSQKHHAAAIKECFG
jgi:hypothetical protein